jgi:hypothetical protein
VVGPGETLADSLVFTLGCSDVDDGRPVVLLSPGVEMEDDDDNDEVATC